ncbi:unnamed protein product [Lota lota]
MPCVSLNQPVPYSHPCGFNYLQKAPAKPKKAKEVEKPKPEEEAEAPAENGEAKDEAPSTDEDKKAEDAE